MVDFDWKTLNEWANATLDRITDIMEERGVTIAPESLVEWTKQEMDLDLDIDVAEKWLKEQPWYLPPMGWKESPQNRPFKETLEAAMQDQLFPLWVLNSTAAGWKGESYKLELFPDGQYRCLWSGEVGNKYETPGVIHSLPALSDEDYTALIKAAGSGSDREIAKVLVGTDQLEEIRQSMRDWLSDHLVIHS